MQAPKRKTSKSVRNMRRSHHALTIKRSSTCANCSEPVVSHNVCKACGYYHGRKILDVAAAQ